MSGRYFASTLFNIILFERVFFTLLFLSCFFRVSFVVIQEVAHRCRFSSVLRNFCWDKDKSYLIDWCILERETCIMHKYTCVTDERRIHFSDKCFLDFLSIYSKYYLKWYVELHDEKYVFLKFFPVFMYLIKKGFFTVTQITSLIKKGFCWSKMY